MTTWTPISKNTATWAAGDRSASLIYLLTDALDNVLVGSSEDEVLIIEEGTAWTVQSKS